jgi:spoIIIJ-associated protein
MEFVETTGKTVEEAKEKALDQLGVHMEDAEFDILEEPKAGLFGRVRGEARVRARVRPAQVRQKLDRRDRKRGDKAEKPGEKADKSDKADKAEKSDKGERNAAPRAEKTTGNGNGNGRQRQAQQPRPKKAAAPKAEIASNEQAEHKEEHVVDARQVGEEASRFMSGLVEAFGCEGTVELVEDGDDLELRVHGKELGLLVGPRGTTLQAVQDLARVASQRRLGDHDTRLRIDIGGYRERRREALGKFAMQMADEVKASGVARVLEPMSSADRKIIHDSLSEVEGIATRSEGDDPYRRVIITPAND